MNKIKTAISLFSGAGGDTLGLENANVKVIGFVEYWKPAIETHLKNFPNSQLIGEDITKIPNEVFLKYQNKVDIITGSPPCQGFSHAGKKNPNDNRNQLFKDFIRVVDIIQPKYFIMENVDALDKREYKNKKYSHIIQEEFLKIKYQTHKFIFNSKDFGVPQNRKRIFFIGHKNTEVLKYSIIPTIKPKSILHVLEKSLKGAIKISNTKGIFFYEGNKNEVPNGKIHPFLKEKINNNLYSFGKRISPNHVEIVDIRNPSKTIHCGYSFQPRMFVPIKNNTGYYCRPFTIKELAQLQGFPKNYIFYGTETNQIKQIGNAVPPQIIKKIIDGVLHF
jgi:DNA (cytosine-5)-methyltransferase 1